MDDINPVQSPGDKMKRALCWLSETVQQHPEKSRRQILEEAQIRFDLSPAKFFSRKVHSAGRQANG